MLTYLSQTTFAISPAWRPCCHSMQPVMPAGGARGVRGIGTPTGPCRLGVVLSRMRALRSVGWLAAVTLPLQWA